MDWLCIVVICGQPNSVDKDGDAEWIAQSNEVK